MHHRSILAAFAASLVLFALPSEAAAQAVYTGAQVKLATDSSLDILKDHVQFLATQDRYDAILGYGSMTARFSPLTYANADGTKTSNLGSRVATMFGGGYGAPSKWGFYLGAWSDIVKIGPNGDSALQGLVFGGIAVLGFQATYSAFVGEKLGGVDAYGNFTGGVSQDAYTYVPGKGVNHDAYGAPKDTFVIYHSSGASLIVLRREDVSQPGSPRVVSDVRAQFQPLRTILDEKLGLPLVAVQTLKNSVDSFSSTRDILAAATSPSGDVAAKPVDVEIGDDDLFAEHIRIHALTRVSPSVRFRAEAGAYRDFDDGRYTAAFRSFFFARDGAFNASLDAFMQVAISRAGPKGDVGFPVSAAVSYSYNSPEAATFVPLPYAHVFGLQFIVGVPDVAKRVVPIVRRKDDANHQAQDPGGDR